MTLMSKIVRPHNIYGARMGFEHVIPQVTKRIFEEKTSQFMGVIRLVLFVM